SPSLRAIAESRCANSRKRKKKGCLPTEAKGTRIRLARGELSEGLVSSSVAAAAAPAHSAPESGRADPCVFLRVGRRDVPGHHHAASARSSIRGASCVAW